MSGYDIARRGLVQQSSQALIARPDVPRSTFVGNWMRKTTFDAGYIVPIALDEVYPGDDITYKITAYVRMATPLFPMFSNFKIETFGFFVPNRLCWTNWVRMMGEQDSPGSSIAYTVPTGPSPAGGYAVGGVHDHYGLPTVGQVTAGQVVDNNIMPLRGYYLIWNQWFRDENSVNGLNVPLGDTTTETGYALQRRMKASDRFTRALPWPQKFTAPTVPLGASAPVIGIGTTSTLAVGPQGNTVYETPSGSRVYGNSQDNSGNNWRMLMTSAGPGAAPQIYADLSQAAGISINTLRLSFLVQELLERDARGGTRYTELMTSHFGVSSPDARLQRPEYIGGGSTPLVLTPIAQTATGGGGLGALGAAGAGVGTHGGRYAAVEHGFIHWFINVQSELAYQQGMHKMWSRRTRYDYYWPSLAGLGEQAILRQEIYATGVDVDDAAVFGYQPAWEELRQRESEVTGLFRSTSAGNIDEWHAVQQFVGAPVLGATFLQDDPPMSRILASASTNMQFLADILFERTATRPLPMHGTPTRLGRF